MQLISYSVLSALILTANAAPSVPENVGNRHARAAVNHDLKARHARRAAQPVPVPIAVPPTLQTRKGKRDALAKQKKCRLRPTGSSSTLVALPTATLGGSNDNSTITASTSASSSTTVDGTTTTTTTSSSADSSATAEYSTQWKIGRTHQGNSFFDAWDFWDRDDPTHGTVRFHSRDSAQSNGLIEINGANNAIMRSGTHDNVDLRNGVRIHDQEVFNVNTLLLMDSVHMPVGCGVWPAWWANVSIFTSRSVSIPNDLIGPQLAIRW